MTDITDHIISTSGLSKQYPGMERPAVASLDLQVQRGEIFGLLGPNGAGKSTTAGMLTTRVLPTAGEALVDGIDIVRRPARAKQVIGVVPQSNTLDRALNVRENLYHHGRFFGIGARDARQRADELLDAFHLARWADAPVMALSGGMAQRLMVARAILHRPAVLFLDEPTAGLDPQSRIVLWEILGKLHADGQTIFLTTHYMEEADELCDRVAIMDHGTILALDSPARLKASIGTESVVTIRTAGDIDELLRLIARDAPAAGRIERDAGGVRVHVGSVPGAVPDLVTAVDRGGFRITDLAIAGSTLETVFLALTGKDLRD